MHTKSQRLENIATQGYSFLSLLPPGSEGWGRYCFHRYLSVHTRGGGGRVSPSPSHNTSTGPMSFPGGYPTDWSSQVPSGGAYPSPRSLLGYPVPRDGVPPSTRDGVSPAPRIGQQRTVCLLRSRRRTFLFLLYFLR